MIVPINVAQDRTIIVASTGCPHGCPDGECYYVDDSGRFNAACGCLESARCGACGGCETCDACYCGED